mmetsp:Transcript_10520/g.25275  ORF Transcript_10520/g.25275 Transcript_10520/m.25275 type:complete len:229 (-) Transcript_10520:293-979(-)
MSTLARYSAPWRASWATIRRLHRRSRRMRSAAASGRRRRRSTWWASARSSSSTSTRPRCTTCATKRCSAPASWCASAWCATIHAPRCSPTSSPSPTPPSASACACTRNRAGRARPRPTAPTATCAYATTLRRSARASTWVRASLLATLAGASRRCAPRSSTAPLCACDRSSVTVSVTHSALPTTRARPARTAMHTVTSFRATTSSAKPTCKCACPTRSSARTRASAVA